MMTAHLQNDLDQHLPNMTDPRDLEQAILANKLKQFGISRSEVISALPITHVQASHARGGKPRVTARQMAMFALDASRPLENITRAHYTKALLDQVIHMTPEKIKRMTPAQRVQVEHLLSLAQSQCAMIPEPRVSYQGPLEEADDEVTKGRPHQYNRSA
jgi:hypothetical protein